jgi:hypothetical protein
MTTASLVAAIPYILSLAAVVGTFYGIIHTNKVNVRLQNDRLKAEERKQNRELLRSKGEELFILLDDHEIELRRQILEVVNSVPPDPAYRPGTFGDYNDAATKLQRIEMLTSVYFPSALETLIKLKSYRQKVSQANSGLYQSQVRNRTDYLTGELMSLCEEVKMHSEALQREITTLLSTLHADVLS